MPSKRSEEIGFSRWGASAMRSATITLATTILIGMIGCSAIPLLNAPRWDITITDAGGHPISGVQVREVAQDYSCESEGHEMTFASDDYGEVHFPAQYIHRNPFQCIEETTSESLAFVHGSFGRHVHAWALVGGDVIDDQGNLYDWQGSPQHVVSRIVLH